MVWQNQDCSSCWNIGAGTRFMVAVPNHRPTFSDNYKKMKKYFGKHLSLWFFVKLSYFWNRFFFMQRKSSHKKAKHQLDFGLRLQSNKVLAIVTQKWSFSVLFEILVGRHSISRNLHSRLKKSWNWKVCSCWEIVKTIGFTELLSMNVEGKT